MTHRKKWMAVTLAALAVSSLAIGLAGLFLLHASLLKTAAELLPPEPWNQETWTLWINQVREKSGKKGRELFHPIRKALTAQENGPELKILLPLIGREKVLSRLQGIAA